MKLFLLLSFVLVSCASYQDKEVVKEAYQLEVRTYEEKRELLEDILSHHSEFDEAKKAEIEKLVDKSFIEGESLRKKESQLLAKILRLSIIEEGPAKELAILKKALKEVYVAKYKNFDSMVMDLKKVIGIYPKNQKLLDEFYQAGFVRF